MPHRATSAIPIRQKLKHRLLMVFSPRGRYGVHYVHVVSTSSVFGNACDPVESADVNRMWPIPSDVPADGRIDMARRAVKIHGGLNRFGGDIQGI